MNASDGELADLSSVFNAVLVRLEQSFEQLTASPPMLRMS